MMSAQQQALDAMENEMGILMRKQEMVPAGSFEGTLIAASIATLQQQIDETESP